MSYLQDTKPVTLFELGKMRAEGRKIAVLTCYDASFAALEERAGVDVILVGDSLGNVLQGQKSTLPVTVEHMVYHTESVVRGCNRPFVIADMPFGSYHESPAQAMRNAARLMAAGAQMVKLEGGAFMAETVHFLVERGVPVCAHIGLTPQSVHQLGGYRVQGRSDEGAKDPRSGLTFAPEEASHCPCPRTARAKTPLPPRPPDSFRPLHLFLTVVSSCSDDYGFD